MASRRRRLRNTVLEATNLRAPQTQTEEPPQRRFTWLPWRREPRQPRISAYTLALAQMYGRGIVAEREAQRALQRRRQQDEAAIAEDMALSQARVRARRAAANAPATPPPSPTTPSTAVIDLAGEEEVGTVAEDTLMMETAMAGVMAARRSRLRRRARSGIPVPPVQPYPHILVARRGNNQWGLTGQAVATTAAAAATSAAAAVDSRPGSRTSTSSGTSTSDSFGTPPSSIPSVYRRRMREGAGTSPTTDVERANAATDATLTPSVRTHPQRDHAQGGPTGGEAAAAEAPAEAIGTEISPQTTVPTTSSESGSEFNPLIMFGEGATIRPEPAHIRSSQARRGERGEASGAAAVDGTGPEARTTSDVAESSRASSDPPIPAPTSTRRGGTGETTRWLNRIIAAFHEHVNATPPLRLHNAGERRLVYPPLIIPVPNYIAWYHVRELDARMTILMGRPLMQGQPTELLGVPLNPPTPTPTPPPPPPPTGDDQTQARARVDERNQRWVLARTSAVPADAGPLPADANGISWACPLCVRLRVCLSPRRLATHMAARHLRPAIYMCGPCTGGEMFVTYDSMERHFNRFHENST